MIYGFAKQSGGHVKIYSEEGHGTTVRLYLPSAGREAEAEGRPAGPIDEAQLLGQGELILVVEDDNDVRAVVLRHLDDLGYRTLTAENADRAIAILEGDEPVVLMFTDVVMPGKITCQELMKKARELRPGLPVLLTSGFSEAAVQGGLFPDDGTELLSKPYRRQDLAVKIRGILQRADA
jgi:CheY-like chemotaxis protein